MRPVMIAMGSLLLAGNLLFAIPLRQNTVLIRNAEQSDQEIRKGIEAALERRGMEPTVVQRMVSEHYGASNTKLTQEFAHFALLFPEVKQDAVVAYVADRVLRRESFAFDNYDHLVAMMHTLVGLHATPSHYDRLRHCVLLNRSLFRSQAAQAGSA